MIEVYAEEGVPPKQVFFYFHFSLLLYLSKSRKESKQECWDKKTAYENFRGYIKTKKFLEVIMRMLSFKDLI